MSATNESQLIGTILHSDDEKVKQNILRSISAPAQVPQYGYNTDLNAQTTTNTTDLPVQEQYRLTPQYYAYYYAQKPIDPRLPVPLIDHTTYTHATRLLQQPQQYTSPLLTGQQSTQLLHPPLNAFDMAGISTDSELLHAASNSSTQHQYNIMDENLNATTTSTPQQYNAFGASMLLHMPTQSTQPYQQSPLLQSQYYTPAQYQYAQPPSTTGSEFDNFDLSKRLSAISIGDGSTDSYSDYSQNTTYYQQPPTSTQYRYTQQRGGNKPMYTYNSNDTRQQYMMPQQQYPYTSTINTPPQFPTQQYNTLNQYNTQYSMQPQSRIRGTLRGRGRGTVRGILPERDRPVYRQPDVVSYTPASAAVELFKQNPDVNNIPLQQCISENILLDLCTDQAGSRYVQQRLDLHNTDETQQCFDSIAPDALRLCTDVFANYVIQKMFEIGTAEQRQSILHVLSGSLFDLSTHMYGCRVIQRAIEVSDIHTQSIIVTELSQHVLQCIRDANGNHVIGKALQCIPSPMNNLLIDTFKHHTVELCCHAYGCRVVQRLLEHSTIQQHQFVIDEILQQIVMLTQNQYGNYVVQHILEHGIPYTRTQIIEGLQSHYVDLARHKFASNVIEKALQYGSTTDKQIILHELIDDSNTNNNIVDPYSDDVTNPLILLVRDQFGNFVIQKMFDCLDIQQRDLLIQRIKQYITVLRKLPYAKHILSKVDKISRDTISKQYSSSNNGSVTIQPSVNDLPPQYNYAVNNLNTHSSTVPTYTNTNNSSSNTNTVTPQQTTSNGTKPLSFAAIASQSVNRSTATT